MRNNRSNNRRNNKAAIAKVFDDLDAFREFCVNYGYVFKEEEMYRSGTFENPTTWDFYLDAKRGRRVTNNWIKDRFYD